MSFISPLWKPTVMYEGMCRVAVEHGEIKRQLYKLWPASEGLLILAQSSTEA